MRRKPLLLIISLLTSLLLFISAIPTSGQGTQVGVRMTGITLEELRELDLPFDVLIDYNAFLWGVLPASGLPQLDLYNIGYQVVEAPYTLSIAEGDIDPLQFSAPSSLDQADKSDAQSEDFYLVQFQGPTKDAWLAALEANGLEIIQYLHPFTYIVWGLPADVDKSQSEPFVRWAGPYRPARPSQRENQIAGTQPVLTRVITYRGQDLETLRRNFEAIGAQWLSQVEGADPSFNQVAVNIPGDRLDDAAVLPGVYALHPLPMDGGNRGELGNQVNAGNLDGAGRAIPGYMAWLNNLGLSGSGVTIANVDSGIDGSHPDLLNRMLPCAGLTCGGGITSIHGTHTAGIMAGDGVSGITDTYGFLRGLGMAPGAGLVEQVYGTVWTDPNRMGILMQESARNHAVISGNSWGPSSIALGYDYDTRLVDIGVRDADPGTPGHQPLSYILSIMNGGGGVSTQGTPDEAKNILTIGSTYLQNADGSQDSRINDLSPNSAHGPALDGRKIPHLVAPGSYVDSTYPGGTHALLGGTSMASPHVTGAVALFYESYRDQFGVDPSPALVKAAFLPVAHDLAGHRDADGQTMGHPFDSQQGWGRLNANTVLDPNGVVWYYDQETTLDYTGSTWSTTLSTTADLTELRAMLAWTDAPGHGDGGTAPAWVNDLDLSLKVGDQTYNGNQFGMDGYSIPDGTYDRKNNTEGIFLQYLPPGEFTFTVTGANISGDGVPNDGDGTDQDFALVIYALPTIQEHKYIFPIFYH